MSSRQPVGSGVSGRVAATGKPLMTAKANPADFVASAEPKYRPYLERFRVTSSITLPLMLPAVVSAFLIAFVSSFDEIIIASFVAGDVVTFPLYLFSQLRFPQLLPQILAVATIVFISSLVVILATEIGRRLVERRLTVEVEPG